MTRVEVPLERLTQYLSTGTGGERERERCKAAAACDGIEAGRPETGRGRDDGKKRRDDEEEIKGR